MSQRDSNNVQREVGYDGTVEASNIVSIDYQDEDLVVENSDPVKRVYQEASVTPDVYDDDGEAKIQSIDDVDQGHVAKGENEPLTPVDSIADSRVAIGDTARNAIRDRFGFLIDAEDTSKMAEESTETMKQLRQREIHLHNSRLVKWTHMLAQGNVWLGQHQALVKRRVRKGIPDPLRGIVWKIFANTEALRKEHESSTYHRLSRRENVDWEEIIARDIHRTFPKHTFFRERHGMGQTSLHNVLRAYSAYDIELGYCQGMGFLAALFLMQMGEEDAFWMLVSLLRPKKKGGMYAMRSMFGHGMSGIKVRCRVLLALLKRRLPKLVSHLVKVLVGGEEELLAIFGGLTTSWFMTNFAYNLPFSVALRVWDIFLYERSNKIAYRVALYVFDSIHTNGNDMMDFGMETLMALNKEFRVDVDTEDMFRLILNINGCERKVLAKLESKYAEQDDDVSRIG